MTTVVPIVSADELAKAIEALSASDFIALDTEFMRESTYFAKLCLIQAATAAHCFVIDPLAIADLEPLWGCLRSRARLKVLHAARQDLEVLSLAAPEAVPAPVFDTQVAAGLLGYPAQIGYASLVTERLGHVLAKGHARTDWTRRPLSREQLEYAADDVRFLVPLYVDLRAALEERGRLAWLFEETRELEDPALYRTQPHEAWRRLKGLERLRADQRAAAKALAEWREATAVAHDKPRGWILADEPLREIAERLPGSEAELGDIRSIPPAVVRKRAAELLELITQARKNAEDGAPPLPPRPEPQQLALVTRLMAFVRAEAEQLKISPEMLATRRDVEQLVFSQRTGRLLQTWRREVIGERLVALATR